MCGEVGEVVGRRVRVHDSTGGERRQTDVRERSERRVAGSHRLERAEGSLDARAVVRADRGQAERTQSLRCIGRPHAADRLCVLVEREQCDDRQRRHSADRVDRDQQLVQVVEGLDHEQVDASALEQLGLFGEERCEVLVAASASGVADRPDRSRDVDISAGDLAGLTRQLDRRLVDRGELVLEEVPAQLASVRPEGVGLDQVGARSNEAEMQRDDALGRSEIRFLGHAEPRHGGRQEHTRAAVGDQRRAVAQTF